MEGAVSRLSDSNISALIADHGPQAGALIAVSYALSDIARALRDLGTGNAATPMGAIEFLALEVQKSGEAVSGALSEIATALAERP